MGTATLAASLVIGLGAAQALRVGHLEPLHGHLQRHLQVEVASTVGRRDTGPTIVHSVLWAMQRLRGLRPETNAIDVVRWVIGLTTVLLVDVKGSTIDAILFEMENAGWQVRNQITMQ